MAFPMPEETRTKDPVSHCIHTTAPISEERLLALQGGEKKKERPSQQVRTVGSDNCQAALHVNAKVQVVEEGWPPGIPKAHVLEADHLPGDRLGRGEPAAKSCSQFPLPNADTESRATCAQGWLCCCSCEIARRSQVRQ